MRSAQSAKSCCALLVFLFIAFPLKAQKTDGAKPTSSEVEFANGAVQITATLLLPPGEGPFPGVVIVHGSGSSDRSNPWTSAYATALVERGIAVLHPDKRGSGASGGAWMTASFLDLADDALAGVAWLRAHPKVAAANVGVIGFSQGGHVVPAAAARSEDIAFAINVSGSTIPIMEQIGDEIAKMGERAEFSDEDLARLDAIHQAGVHYALTGEGWRAYADLLAEAKRGSLSGSEAVDGFPEEPDASAWGFLRTIGDFDPMDYWTALHVPMLFVYGGRDTQLRIRKSIDRIQDVLAPGDQNVSILLFQNNGHALYREDLLDFMARWIKDKGEH